MECACGLFAPTYSQQKPVYYPASQSSMKLVGALVYHSPTERAPPLSPLAALSSALVWKEESFNTKDAKYRERVFWQRPFSSAIIP